MKLGSRLAVILLGVVSVARLLRVIFGVWLAVVGVEIPLRVSVPGCLVPGGIAVLLGREGRERGQGAS